MNIKILLIVFFMLAAAGIFIPAQENASASNTEEAGAAEMVLEGGFLGAVDFPHRIHQKQLDDCNACHSLYPMEKGAIDRLEKSGELKNQQVMNSQCMDCHRKSQAEGVSAGPTQCSGCHVK